MADISLSAGIRSNLISLQNTASLLNQTQTRLGTGKKVNSAIDNPSNFFTAQSLTNRATDLTARLDGIAKGINTVKAADTGIKSITSLLKQAKGAAQDARALKTDDTDGRAEAVKRFNDLRTQINQLAEDSGYDGVNLLAGDKLDVQFGEKINDSSIALVGFDASTAATTGLDITEATSTATTGWGNQTNATAGNDAIDVSIKELEDAEAKIRNESKKLSANLGVLTTRQDFTKNMVNSLTTGADELTNADLNAEAANLLALNTQQSLGVNSLSLASQASQSVLRLLQ